MQGGVQVHGGSAEHQGGQAGQGGVDQCCKDEYELKDLGCVSVSWLRLLATIERTPAWEEDQT